MNWSQLLQSVVTALVIAGVFGFLKLFRDRDKLQNEFDKLKTTHEYEIKALRSSVDDVVTWYKKTSMDALKIAANPTSERLTELANRYIDSVKGQGEISVKEKQELIDGLRAILNDPKQYESKRQSASMSLRFIEGREGLTATNSNH